MGVRASSKINTSAIALAIGALLIAVGSFLPWMWTSPYSSSAGWVNTSGSGIDAGRDGMVTLGIGMVLGVVAFAHFSRDSIGRGFRVLSFFGGLGAIAIAIIHGSALAWQFSQPVVSYPSPSPCLGPSWSPFCGGLVFPTFGISGAGSGWVGPTGFESSWIGAGIFLVGIGGAVAVLAALLAPVLRRLRPPEMPRPA